MVEPASDRAARAAALDPSRSFIVQAPAGSGKTELLIQRYLKLLTTVREPEQVVAITFTRKAAGEMRSRILQALRSAAAPAEDGATQREETRALAKAALQRDAERQWSVLAQPQRLRIDTLDALNASLAQHLPLLAGGVAGARLVEDAEAQYRQAARRTLDELETDSPIGEALRSLLPLLDNAVPRMERLLAQLLPKRDQWLRHLIGVGGHTLRRQLESGLARLIDDEIASLRASWPEDSLPQLVALLRHAAMHAERERTRQALGVWTELETMPTGGADALRAWRGAEELLLTRHGRWRRRAGAPEGFGPGQQAAKDRLYALLRRLSQRDDLAAGLVEIGALPEPRYSDAQWRDLEALRRVLTHLVAELRLIFVDEQSVDFVELGIAAREALGRVDQPSNLLLALDQRIQHLMVDEFQDTSHAQIRLLELLTAGWEPGDGRSLFFVGDPMQSIYRFRDADVSLFLTVQQRGIGHLRCTPLTLRNNYRSGPAIVDWINGVFAGVFPGDDEIARGAVRFYPCRAMREAATSGRVEVHAVTGAGEDAEIETVVDILEQAQRDSPDQSIAILVQSRSHLVGLHEKLLAGGWPIHAVELEAIADQQVGQDLIGLTRALCHVGDRIAWLGVLRAPWCGLTWDDLHRLCANSPERSIWALLNDPAQLERLSSDGRRRAAALRGVLGEALDRRGAVTFSRWIEQTWLQLEGPACLARASEHAAANRYFRRLDELAPGGDLADPALLETAFSRAAGEGEAPRGTGIEIMTIHRAKGLEFDTVVLFGLGRAARRDDAKILHWMERRRSDGGDDLLMAPLARDQDRLAACLRRIDLSKEEAERARLLYVAMTRAKENLHLVAHHDASNDRPPSRSLLHLLWPRLATDFAGAPRRGRPPLGEGAAPRLRRLRDLRPRAAAPRPAAVPVSPVTATLEYEWVGQTAVQVGALVHRYLERFAEFGLAAWTGETLRQRSARFRRELALLGVVPTELDEATARVVEALDRVLNDSRGRWLLAQREESESELRLTVPGAAGLEHLRLDRSFVDDGIRWIVDYKTSRHEGGDLEAFLDTEVERYREQLERYAAAMADLDPRPIRLGLYFPLLGAFRHWTPGEKSSTSGS